MSVARFLVDECLSPELARRLAQKGYDATSVRDRGKLGQHDTAVFDYAMKEDRILITQNADDFRKLVGDAEMHPGLIILSANAIETSWAQLEAALAHAIASANPSLRDWMFNRVVEVDKGGVTDYELPPLVKNAHS